MIAALVLAAAVDMGVVAVAPSKAEVRYDETYRLTVRVRNFGTAAAPNAFVIIGGNSPGVIVGIDTPAGWTCQSPGRESIQCRTPSMAAGAEAEMAVTLTAPQPTPIAYRVGAQTGADGDDTPANNYTDVSIALLDPGRHADLVLTMQLERNPVREGEEIRAAVDVRNEGPDDAHDVLVAFAQDIDPHVTLLVSGAGWSCAPAGSNVLCRRAELRAGASAPLVLRATAPRREVTVRLSARVRAEANRDFGNGNLRTFTIGVGSAANWERVLFPITSAVIAGAGGARWTTELTALILGEAVPEHAPTHCEIDPSPVCAVEPAPLRRQFDAFHHLVAPATTRSSGQFFYLRPADARKLRFNARIYDAAREERTAGAEVPIVRDADFTSDVIALLNIPVIPEVRHTLRIYDADGRDETLVRIRIYSGFESEPRVEVVRGLRTLIRQSTTTAFLPTHPAYAQEELLPLLPPGPLEPLRVEIEPVTPGVRLWAFVSITNNETHHVTVVTPQ